MVKSSHSCGCFVSTLMELDIFADEVTRNSPVPAFLTDGDNIDTNSCETNNEENGSRKRSFHEMEKSNQELDYDREEGLLCPVCLDAWTSAGPHRLCSLRCGHLFGLSCATRWLSGRNRSCPTCNAASRKSDIREIYASKLVVVDTSELENLRVQCLKLQAEKQELQTQLNLQKAFVEYYKTQCEKPEEERTCNVQPVTFKQSVTSRLLTSLRLDEGSCRVIAYCSSNDLIAVSQEHLGPLWPGFGVRLISKNATQLSPLHPLHKKELRDIVFHPTNPDLLLSVAFDNHVKVFDLTSYKATFSWSGEHRIWSCCWDVSEQQFAYIGTERGLVIRLDTVGGLAPCLLPLPVEQIKPVAVVGLRASRRLGYTFCCRLLSLSAYKAEGEEFRCVLLEKGKFSAMAFSEDEDGLEPTLVLTCRPEAETNRVRCLCYRIQAAEGSIKCNLIQVFICGEHNSQLSRPCLLSTPAGLLYFAFNETCSTVTGWYMGQDKKVVSIRTHNFVRDLLAVQRGKQLLLFILTPNILKCYELL